MVKPKLSVRLPPRPVDPNLAQQFIATGDIPEHPQTSGDVQEHPKTSATVHTLPVEPRSEESQTSADVQPVLTKALVTRQGGKVRRRMTLYLEPTVAETFMAWCADNGREASHAAGQAIAAWLAVHQKG